MLDLSQLKEDFYVTVTVPIRDLDLANFDFAKEYSDSGYDIYNKSGDFYNDVCSPATANDNDIILKDRKKEFIEQNKTVCQEECDFSDYDYNINKANCSCLVKESSSSISDTAAESSNNKQTLFFKTSGFSSRVGSKKK